MPLDVTTRVHGASEALAFPACYQLPLAAPESTLSFAPNSSTYLVTSIYIPILECLSLSNLSMADVPTQTQRLALHEVGPRSQGSGLYRRGLTLAQAGSSSRRSYPGIRVSRSSVFSGAPKRFLKKQKKKVDVPGKFVIPSRPFRARYHFIQALSTKSIPASHILNSVSLPHLDLIIFALYWFLNWP